MQQKQPINQKMKNITFRSEMISKNLWVFRQHLGVGARGLACGDRKVFGSGQFGRFHWNFKRVHFQVRGEGKHSQRPAALS